MTEPRPTVGSGAASALTDDAAGSALTPLGSRMDTAPAFLRRWWGAGAAGVLVICVAIGAYLLGYELSTQLLDVFGRVWIGLLTFVGVTLKTVVHRGWAYRVERDFRVDATAVSVMAAMGLYEALISCWGTCGTAWETKTPIEGAEVLGMILSLGLSGVALVSGLSWADRDRDGSAPPA